MIWSTWTFRLREQAGPNQRGNPLWCWRHALSQGQINADDFSWKWNALKGSQSISKALKCSQRLSKALKGSKRLSRALKGSQMLSKGSQMHSKALKRLSNALKGSQKELQTRAGRNTIPNVLYRLRQLTHRGLIYKFLSTFDPHWKSQLEQSIIIFEPNWPGSMLNS